MHSYNHVTPKGEMPDLPAIDSLTFNSADDLVALAELDESIGWKTWPEVWHLDDNGQFRCYFKGSSLDSIRGWADDPVPLRRSRREGLASGGCGSRWVIVDSRPCWRHPTPAVDESDVKAFTQLQQHLDTIGVMLVDVVIFDDDGHWWSLHELTTGTSVWAHGSQWELAGEARSPLPRHDTVGVV